MSFVILAIGFAGGHDCPHAGQYLETFDHDTADGLGYGEFTADLTKAKRFDTFKDAFEFWRQQSKTRPRRWYGDRGPNRPLTALTVEIFDPEARKEKDDLQS